MIPTFLAFQTASRALAASQANINITGNNIANANTEGYSRQRVDLSSFSTGGSSQKFATPNYAGSLGVQITGIGQIRDIFLDARYRNENSNSGMYDKVLAGLKDLENVLDELSTAGLQEELLDFTRQLQTLSESPTSEELTLVVRTSAQKVTQIMNVYARQLSEAREQAIYDLSNVVVNNEFNTLVKNIASLNEQIKKEHTYRNNPNELLDKRNLLIDQLSNIANIKVTVTPDKISEDIIVENLEISIYDEKTGISIGLIDNGLYNELSVIERDGKISLELTGAFDAHDTDDITDHFSSGAIKGYLDIINGSGIYADTAKGENDFRGTLYYMNAMDTFAATFAKVFNDLNDIDPGDENAMPLFSANDGSGIITAANIAISEEWINSSTYINTSKIPGGDNDNVLRMINAMEGKLDFYMDVENEAGLVFKGTFNEYMTGLIGELSLDISLYKNFSDTSDAVLTSLFNSRESISGVNLDEEGINLMAHQKAYNAAARYFTILDEAIDRIINNMGVAGR
ncbi:MAG: flagellar hook-associated protein FlgK [Clostridiales bacterium]|jgi:flagellar hook-associated protein 1 FlgK|nr:flagellar hook-associated protein FlgK [Clostridiales bacterium]